MLQPMHPPPRPSSRYESHPLLHPEYVNLWRSLKTRLQPPEGAIAMAAEAIAWVAGAAAFRIVVDVLMLMMPWLWPPVFAVLIAPAAIAICLSLRAPLLSLLLGYRLCLIATGLLIGG